MDTAAPGQSSLWAKAFPISTPEIAWRARAPVMPCTRVCLVPRMLVARIPSDAVSFDEAAFTTLGAVALHGVRNADVKLGDVVAVIGLGLLGQLTVQILKAAGCCVLGMDISDDQRNWLCAWARMP